VALKPGKFKLGEPARGKAERKVVPATEFPVARVVLDTPVPHLAREFDYLVPSDLAAIAQPGVRVKIKFGRQDLGGFIIERLAQPEQLITLADLVPLKKVVSPEPVLRPEILALASSVADYYGGTVPDVLRFAVPPRHARAETAPPEPALSRETDDATAQAPPAAVPQTEPWLASWLNSWNQYQNGPELLNFLTQPNAQPSHIGRFVWTPLPGLAAPKPPETVPHLPLWAAQIAALVAPIRSQPSPGGVLIVAPDNRDVERIIRALDLAGIQQVTRLVADEGVEARYRAFLAVERGQAQVVVGTRSAVFAPVANLQLMILWGDGDDSLAELHTPRFEAREVLALRNELTGVPLLVGSLGRTVAAQRWVDDGEIEDGALSIVGYRDTIRSRAPLTKVIDSAENAAEGYLPRIPTLAAQAVREALTRGPVLVQVPLTGYLPSFDCQNCRAPARCAACGGPLTITDPTLPPSCRTCGQLAPNWHCPNCGSTRIRSRLKGADRTAEELGRTFPGTRIVVSTATAPGGVKSDLPRPTKPVLVIATPGAEPVMPGGYAAALILDAGATPARVSLDMSTEALRRWLTVAHLVVPAAAGGQLLLVGDGDPAATAALVRFDPVLLAERELAERIEAGMPPAVRMAEITGDAAAVDSLVSRLALADASTMLGPTPLEIDPLPDAVAAEALFTEPQVRVLLRVPQTDGLELARQLRASLAVRSAKREPGAVKVTLDPAEFC